ncbi:MAG: hypothetical protein WCB62_14630, partial [Pseudolabrys sp.]
VDVHGDQGRKGHERKRTGCLKFHWPTLPTATRLAKFARSGSPCKVELDRMAAVTPIPKEILQRGVGRLSCGTDVGNSDRICQ